MLKASKLEVKTGKECSQKLFNKDGVIFREYVENTTAHGVVRMFKTHYSIVRRLFWLVVFLGAAAFCLNNCIERIRFLARRPTSTTTSIRSQRPLVFPAVTICNLNHYTATGLLQAGLLDVGQGSLNIDPLDPSEVDNCKRNLSGNAIANQTRLEYLNRNASQPLSEFVLNCTYLGKVCDLDRDFEETVLGIGTCYTFNGIQRHSSLTTEGTGSRQGLFMLLNIDQDEYVASGLLDAGARISIQPWYEPSQVLDQGISIPTGRFAFIGISEERIINNAGVDCVSVSDTDAFNFLFEAYDLSYSLAACTLDCLYTAIVDNCGCYHRANSFPSNKPLYSNARNCTFSDVCCIQRVLNSAMNCDCPTSCNTTYYNALVSYSTFPAQYVREAFETSESSDLEKNLVGLSVYFRTPSVRTETTNFAYTFIALLSDIGGQLGLFLGVSVISILEFGTWLLDEGLERLCCCRIVWKRKKAGIPSDNIEGSVNPVSSRNHNLESMKEMV